MIGVLLFILFVTPIVLLSHCPHCWLNPGWARCRLRLEGALRSHRNGRHIYSLLAGMPARTQPLSRLMQQRWRQPQHNPNRAVTEPHMTDHEAAPVQPQGSSSRPSWWRECSAPPQQSASKGGPCDAHTQGCRWSQLLATIAYRMRGQSERPWGRRAWAAVLADLPFHYSGFALSTAFPYFPETHDGHRGFDHGL